MSDAPNYITPAGFSRLSEELARLWRVKRPRIVETVAWAAGNGDRSENGDYIYGKQKLRQIDRRIRHLSKRLDCAVVVDNAGKAHERVHFGATVTFAHEAGDQRTVTIVGVDELDAGDTRISWRSAMAAAMLKARVGDVVTMKCLALLFANARRTREGPSAVVVLVQTIHELRARCVRQPVAIHASVVDGSRCPSCAASASLRHCLLGLTGFCAGVAGFS